MSSDRKLGVGFPGGPDPGAGMGPGIVLPKNPGWGIFALKTPGFSGVF